MKSLGGDKSPSSIHSTAHIRFMSDLEGFPESSVREIGVKLNRERGLKI